jgi:hypothetical protein
MNRFSSSAVRCSARNLPTSWRSELAVGHGTLLLQVRPDLGQSAHPNPILKGGESCPAVDNMHAGRPRVYGARVGICARKYMQKPGRWEHMSRFPQGCRPMAICSTQLDERGCLSSFLKHTLALDPASWD